jgi:hypothetical protein
MLPQDAGQRETEEAGTIPSGDDNRDRFHARDNITATYRGSIICFTVRDPPLNREP